MTARIYDLSIISDQEAADRLGVRAAEIEDHHLDDFDPFNADAGLDYVYVAAANRATVALDVLALRKAQAVLDTRHRGSIHPFFVDLDLNGHAAVQERLTSYWQAGFNRGVQECQEASS